jgi:transcriptional regulator with XRE-family HTH domain
LDSVRKNIKKYRLHRNLTQEQLGLMLGMKRGTINKIEKNKRPITDNEIFNIATVLEVPPQALIDDGLNIENLNSTSLKSNLSNDNSILVKSLENIIRKIVSEQHTKRS